MPRGIPGSRGGQAREREPGARFLPLEPMNSLTGFISQPQGSARPVGGMRSKESRRLLPLTAVLMAVLAVGLLPPLSLSATGSAPERGWMLELEGARLPAGRWGVGAAQAGEYIYLFGGLGGGGVYKDILQYDSRYDSFKLMGASLPFPLQPYNAVWDGRYVFLFGGHKGDSSDSDIILRYDPDTDKLTVTGARLPTPRRNVGAVFDGQAVYLFGGYDGTYVREILRYNPSADRLEKLQVELPRGAEAPVVTWDGSAVYILGGVPGMGQGDASDIFRFSPAQLSVTTMKTQVLGGVAAAPAIWNGESILVFGGKNLSTQAQNSILRYDARLDRLDTLSAQFPRSIRGAAAAWLNGAAFIFGGADVGWVGLQDVWRLRGPVGSLSGPPVVLVGAARAYALEPIDGTLLWRQLTSSAASDDARNIVILQHAGKLTARDAPSGQEIWSYTPSEGSLGMAPHVASGRVYILESGKPAFSAMDMSSGSLLWTNPIQVHEGMPDDAIPFRNLEAGGLFLVLWGQQRGADWGEVQALEAATGRPLWKAPIPSPWPPGPAVDQGTLYFFGRQGDLNALGLDSHRIRWSRNVIPPAENQYGQSLNMLVHNGTLFFSINNVTYAISAFDGTALWKSSIPTRSQFWAPAPAPVPVVRGKSLIVGLVDTLASLDPQTGCVHWHLTTGNRIGPRLVTTTDTVYFAADNRSASGAFEWVRDVAYSVSLHDGRIRWVQTSDNVSLPQPLAVPGSCPASPLIPPIASFQACSSKSGRIEFSGFRWEARDSGGELQGPGPNYWSPAHAFCGPDGLHLRVAKREGSWKSAEVYINSFFRFGTTEFTVLGRLDRLDPRVVLGLFLCDEEACDRGHQGANEIDVEFSRWGNITNSPGLYTVWPNVYGAQDSEDCLPPARNNREGGKYRCDHAFELSAAAETVHQIVWQQQGVAFRSFVVEATGERRESESWEYCPQIPATFIPQNPGRVRMNLWLLNPSAYNGDEVEVAVKSVSVQEGQPREPICREQQIPLPTKGVPASHAVWIVVVLPIVALVAGRGAGRGGRDRKRGGDPR